MKNRMREICTSGSVRDGGGNVPIYSATISSPPGPLRRAFGHFENVHKSFARPGQAPLVAIDSISFDLAAGKFVSLLGPSGCGKTTFLRIVAGLISFSSGSVQINGVDVTGPHPDFGIAFQQANLMPWRTVLKNVLFPIEILRQRHKEVGSARLNFCRWSAYPDSSRPTPHNSPAVCSSALRCAGRSCTNQNSY